MRCLSEDRKRGESLAESSLIGPTVLLPWCCSLYHLFKTIKYTWLEQFDDFVEAFYRYYYSVVYRYI